MRLTLLALIGVACIACSFAQPLEDAHAEHEDLVLVSDHGLGHANEGARATRQIGWGGGWNGWRGGYGGGGWGGGWGGGLGRGWGGGWGGGLGRGWNGGWGGGLGRGWGWGR